MQVSDLRLTAKLPDGQPFELKKEFEVGGLAGVLGEMQKQRVGVTMAKLKSELEVVCPCCQATLVIDTNLGRVVSHKEPERGNKPELSEAQRILAEAGGAPRSDVPAVGRCGENARRRAVEALRGGAPSGQAGADHQADARLRSGLATRNRAAGSGNRVIG